MRMKTPYRIIPAPISTLLILPTLSLPAQHRVIRVVDGDTIVVDYKGKYVIRDARAERALLVLV